MNAERNDPSVWKELYERGKQLAADVDIETTTLRTAGRQQHRVNIPQKSQTCTDKEPCIFLWSITSYKN